MDMKKLLIDSFTSYDAKQEQENELQKKIDALKSEQTKIKYEREKLGDVINLIGTRKKSFDYYDYEEKHRELLQIIKSGDEAAKQAAREKCRKYYEQYKNSGYDYKARTTLRGWHVIEIDGTWTNKHVYFEIDNKRRHDTVDSWHHYSDLKTYGVSLIWREDLKKYKYEIEVSLPDKERSYNPNVKTSKKAKTIDEALPILKEALQEVWQDFTTSDNVYNYKPDIWDFCAADIDNDVKSIDAIKLLRSDGK